MNGETRWQKIIVQGDSGWVNADFLILSDSGSTFSTTPETKEPNTKPAPIFPNINPNAHGLSD